MKLLLASSMLLITLSVVGITTQPVKAANPNILYIAPLHMSSGQSVGATINFAVKVSQVDPFNAWDIQVAVDPTVLNPVSFTITPNALTANYSLGELELSHCVNGSGSGCVPSSDVNGVVHSAVFPLGASPSVASVSGVLFNITYSVVNPNAATAVHLQNANIVSNGIAVVTTNQDGSYGTPPRDNTSTTVACSPSSILAGETSTCTVTVVDTTTASNTPTGTVSFVATGVVTPSSASCNLASGNCTVTFTGTVAGTASVTGAYGGDLTHNASVAGAATITVGPNTTATSVTCVSPVLVGQSSTCSAMVTGGSTTPTGSVAFASDAALLPSSVSCLLSATASCSVTITTPAGSGGTHTVAASYGGDASHSPSSGSASLVVSDFTIIANPTTLIVPVGGSNSTSITLTSLGGFTGSITLSTSSLVSGVTAGFVPNPVALVVAGNTVSSQLTISVAASVSDFSVTVTGASGGLSHVTSPISVHVIPAPVFASGKLHWAHHLSLLKSGGTQTWTAFVDNPTPNSVSVLVHIVGTSQTNPSLSFDITCGTTCVNTGSPVTPVTVAAGGSMTFSFSQSIPSAFVGNKLSFTATLLWAPAGSMPSTPSSSKSGVFTVLA